MRDTRFFTTAFAAALASLLGLGPEAAAALDNAPPSFQSAPESGEALPVWLVRYKLRRQGYQDIAEVRPADGGFAVRASDRWGRPVRLFVEAHSGEVAPRPGYGLAHLKAEDLDGHLADLGYRLLAPSDYRDGEYRVVALDGTGTRRLVRVDALTGAAWF